MLYWSMRLLFHLHLELVTGLLRSLLHSHLCQGWAHLEWWDTLRSEPKQDCPLKCEMPCHILVSTKMSSHFQSTRALVWQFLSTPGQNGSNRTSDPEGFEPLQLNMGQAKHWWLLTRIGTNALTTGSMFQECYLLLKQDTFLWAFFEIGTSQSFKN